MHCRHSGTTKYLCLTVLFVCLILSGCKAKAIDSGETGSVSYEISAPETAVSPRSNESVVLTPVAGGELVYGCDTASIDATNASEGYLFVCYTGDNPKVKMQLTGPDQVTYTYNILTSEAVIPITAGNGSYTAVIFENIADNQYSTLFATDMELNVSNTFGPYLYPNQQVNFTADSKVVAEARELATGASSDIEVVANVYAYIIDNITYDEEKLSTAEKSYIPDVDQILESKTGICLDYASVMAAMLRSQRIPTRLEIGYAGDAYHAWISVYIGEQGWVSGMIEFNGADWTLMDPTFAANTKASELKSFIGDGSNYVTKYIY